MNRKGFTLIILFLILGALAIGASIFVDWHQHQSLRSSISPISGTTSTKILSGLSSTTPQASIWGQYDINTPNALILADSQGRRTGKDPITGVIYHEIPNTAYGEIASTPGHLVGELTFSDLSNGQYTLYVLGGKTGLYGVGINNNQGEQAFQGDIQKGSMIAYLQNYDSANLASSTFSFEETLSSTASITSAPPNNLPVPAVP